MRRKRIACIMLCTLSLQALAYPADKNDLAHQLDAMLRSSVGNDAPGASVLVAQDDKVIYRGAYGKANLDLNVALTPQHVFRIGSITKTFTAAAMVRLSATRQLSLDDPLSKYLPDFPNGGHITLAQLLSHTSGVSDNWDADPGKPLDTPSLVKLIAAKAPDFEPGAAWSYSNSGYILLGAVLEKVTGKPWAEAIHDQLTARIGLDHTAFYADDAIVPGLVSGYSQNESGKVTQAPYVTISGPGAAGALVSTTDDLFRWMRALATDRALPAGLYQTMSSPKSTARGDPVPYGYGLMLGTVRGESIIEHNGGIDGFASQLTYFPTQHVTVVVLANTDAGSPSPRSLAHRLGALAIGKPYAELDAAMASTAYLQGLSGAYRIAENAKHILSIEHGNLVIQRDGGPKRALAVAKDDVLFFPSDKTDHIKVIRDTRGAVTALDFYADGMPPARHETRLP
ncbi:CubicO group peptidase, beta-lactamase class C family [Dyella sp. OK004]|nr:CubicO group peptidase, beta-lactamase class C family [Dyella sp. OK004]